MKDSLNLPDQDRLVVSQQRAGHIIDVCVDTIEDMVRSGLLERVRISSRKYGITMRSIRKLIGEAS